MVASRTGHRRLVGIALALTLLALLGPCRLLGQDAPREGRSTPALVTVGVGAGLLGFGLGGGVGFLTGFASNCDDDPGACLAGGISGFVLGAAAGEALMLPFGVHLANRRQGRLWLELLTSIGVATVGVAAASLADGSGAGVPIVVAIPVTQLYLCIREERRR